MRGGGFNTYQTVQNYEDALGRHAQHVRWMRAILCPCLNPNTGQPNPRCNVCDGRGRIFTPPKELEIKQEIAKHNNNGQIYPQYTPVVEGKSIVYRRGNLLPVSPVQPADGSYIMLSEPYPRMYERLKVDYTYTPVQSVTDENSRVLGNNLIQVIAPEFTDRGKRFTGSISKVTRVYNVTRDETYSTDTFAKDFIYVSDMGTYQSGDIMEVDYEYVAPFPFVIHGISDKVRYESTYIMDEGECILLTPYFCNVAPDDRITALASEEHGSAIINPRLSIGNDVIRNYFDVVSILRIIDINGVEHDVDDVQLYGRNEIKWLVTKPTVNYTVSLLYNPTYIALPAYTTLRNAENKTFARKINLKKFDVTSEVKF